MKTFEEKILSMKYEDLLHFLINDIVKTGFFADSNFDRFNESYRNLIISDGLFSNLENEATQDELLNSNQNL